MKRQPCPDCQRPRGFRRSFGLGTVLALLLTGGLWLVALPFYPLRCRECGARYQPKWWEFSWR